MTNQIQYLKHVDDIVVMENNEISERGSYEDLLRHNGAFAQFMRTHLTELDASDEEGGEKLKKEEELEWMEVFEKKKKETRALKAEIDKTDKEIDEMVYELYGLTEKEIAIVENS